MTIEQIAQVTYEVNLAYCQSIGDNSFLPWNEAPEWQRDTCIKGVKMHLENPNATQKDSHESWLEEKRKEGWQWGPFKNPERKEHPCFVPYDELPAEQKAKDYIFRQIVHSLKGFNLFGSTMLYITGAEMVVDFQGKAIGIEKAIIKGIDTNKVSDGYHTFDELYSHRIALFIALCKQRVELYAEHGSEAEVWRSRKHSDGELAFGGSWFVLGIGKEPGKQITYHLPMTAWEQTEFAETLEQAPTFDGHTSNDVLLRLLEL